MPLLKEITQALRGKLPFEVLYVDDASQDETVAQLTAVRGEFPELRILKHSRNSGQSRSVRTGVLNARGTIVATLDGDGQNDPADIVALWQVWNQSADRAQGQRQGGLALVAGQRRKREDSFMKRLASRFGNGVRGYLLNDHTRDTGCGLKLFARDAFLRLPYFDHMHRYLPALMLREGFQIAHVDVNHRPRGAGRSKYGTLDRLMVSIRDLMGVMWLTARARNPQRIDEI